MAKLEAVLDTIVATSNSSQGEQTSAPVLHEIEVIDSLSKLNTLEKLLKDKNEMYKNWHIYVAKRELDGTIATYW